MSEEIRCQDASPARFDRTLKMCTVYLISARARQKGQVVSYYEHVHT